MDVVAERPGLQGGPAESVILLDTNAVIWLEQRHKRARPLAALTQELYVSPASLLELQFLHEAGRIRLPKAGAQTLADDQHWQVDDPPAAAWFAEAGDLAWTRDPFDRLIVGHARVRGWRLATGDTALLSRLPASKVVQL